LFPYFLKIMEDSVSTYKTTNSPKDKDVVVATLEAFLTLFTSLNDITQSENDDISKSIEYMERNYMNNITIKEISNMLYLSEDYYIRKFKRAIGMTPYSYLSRLRLSIAKELISGGASLQKAAIPRARNISLLAIRGSERVYQRRRAIHGICPIALRLCTAK